MKFIKRMFRALKDIVLNSKDPQKLAKGFALGSFIGMMPIPGFQVLVSVSLAHFFRWNKYAAAIAVFNTNLYTGLLLFYLNFKLGGLILGLKPAFHIPDRLGLTFVIDIWNSGIEVFASLLVRRLNYRHHAFHNWISLDALFMF